MATRTQLQENKPLKDSMQCDIAVQKVLLRDSPKANHAKAYYAFDALRCY